MKNIFNSIIHSYKNTFSISGRAGIYEFCIFILFTYPASYISFEIIDVLYTLFNYDNIIIPFLEIILTIIFLATIYIPSFTLFIRRLHDLNKSG